MIYRTYKAQRVEELFIGNVEFLLARRFQPNISGIVLNDMAGRWLLSFEDSDVFPLALAFACCVLSNKAPSAFLNEIYVAELANDLKEFLDVDPIKDGASVATSLRTVHSDRRSSVIQEYRVTHDQKLIDWLSDNVLTAEQSKPLRTNPDISTLHLSIPDYSWRLLQTALLFSPVAKYWLQMTTDELCRLFLEASPQAVADALYLLCISWSTQEVDESLSLQYGEMSIDVIGDKREVVAIPDAITSSVSASVAVTSRPVRRSNVGAEVTVIMSRILTAIRNKDVNGALAQEAKQQMIEIIIRYMSSQSVRLTRKNFSSTLNSLLQNYFGMHYAPQKERQVVRSILMFHDSELHLPSVATDTRAIVERPDNNTGTGNGAPNRPDGGANASEGTRYTPMHAESMETMLESKKATILDRVESALASASFDLSGRRSGQNRTTMLLILRQLYKNPSDTGYTRFDVWRALLIEYPEINKVAPAVYEELVKIPALAGLAVAYKDGHNIRYRLISPENCEIGIAELLEIGIEGYSDYSELVVLLGGQIIEPNLTEKVMQKLPVPTSTLSSMAVSTPVPSNDPVKKLSQSFHKYPQLLALILKITKIGRVMEQIQDVSGKTLRRAEEALVAGRVGKMPVTGIDLLRWLATFDPELSQLDDNEPSDEDVCEIEVEDAIPWKDYQMLTAVLTNWEADHPDILDDFQALGSVVVRQIEVLLYNPDVFDHVNSMAYSDFIDMIRDAYTSTAHNPKDTPYSRLNNVLQLAAGLINPDNGLVFAEEEKLFGSEASRLLGSRKSGAKVRLKIQEFTEFIPLITRIHGQSPVALRKAQARLAVLRAALATPDRVWRAEELLKLSGQTRYAEADLYTIRQILDYWITRACLRRVNENTYALAMRDVALVAEDVLGKEIETFTRRS